MDGRATRLSDFPIHLGLGASAEIEPEFTGEMEWYAGSTDLDETTICRLSARRRDDLADDGAGRWR